MSKFLTQDQVDATFNGWWNAYGGKPESVSRALRRTILQIYGEPVRRPNGPFPPGYSPPPRRNKSNVKKTSKPASKNDSRTLKRQAQQKAGAGRAAADNDLRKMDRETSRRKRRYEVLKRYKTDVDNANRNSHQWKYQQETERLRREQRRKLLKEIAWMSKNTIGAGIYGIHREAGGSHADAMARAKDTQSVFDLASNGIVSPKRAREKNSVPHNTRSHRSSSQTVGPPR